LQKLYGIRDLIGAGGRVGVIPVSRATLYRMIAAGKFPKPRKLGYRSIWTEEDVCRWREQWVGGER